MLNSILDEPQYPQSSEPPAAPVPVPSKPLLIAASASRLLTGRIIHPHHHHHHHHQQQPTAESWSENLFDDDENYSGSSFEGVSKFPTSSDSSKPFFSDSSHSSKPVKQSNIFVLKNKLANNNHRNNANINSGAQSANTSNNPTSFSFPSTSFSPLGVNQSIHSNGSAPNNNKHSNTNNTNNKKIPASKSVSSMNSSSSLTSNTSSTGAPSNTVSNSNSNSSLRVGTSSFAASHAHHSSHGTHPLYHGNFASSSAINGSRQQQEMKRHLNRVRNEQSLSNSGLHSSPPNSNVNSATNSYIDSDGNRLRHYSSVGSNNSFRSTDDEMFPTSSAPPATSSGTTAGPNAAISSVSRKLSDSSSIESPLRVNRSASSLRMANSVDSQLGTSKNSNNNNNINSNGNGNGNGNPNSNSTPSSSNNTSNNISAMLNGSAYSSLNINEKSATNRSDSPAVDSKRMSPALPSTVSTFPAQSQSESSSISATQAQTASTASASFSTSPDLHSSASQPAIASSTTPDYQSLSQSYSTSGLASNQSNGRPGYDSARVTNTSRVKRFGRGLGPPMRAPKRESEEGLTTNSTSNNNNNTSNSSNNQSAALSYTLSASSDDLNKKPSAGSIKDREMIDVNTQNSDLTPSNRNSAQLKNPDDSDLQMSSAAVNFSKPQNQEAPLEHRMSTDEDFQNGSESRSQPEAAGDLQQHNQGQFPKQQLERLSPVAAPVSSSEGNYFGQSSATSAALDSVQQQLPQLHLQNVAPPLSPYADSSPSFGLVLEDKIERELTLERQHEELRHYLQIQEKLIQEQQKQILMQKQQKEQLEEEQAKAKAKAEAEAEAQAQAQAQAQAKAAQEQQQQNKQQSSNATAAASASGRKQKNLIYVNSQPYQRLELIGRGGSSKVYKAQSTTGKIYAIKRVSCDEDIDDTVLKGFKGEIDLLQRLNEEDRVVKLIDYEMRATSIYVVMECGEIDLAHVLNARLSLPLDISFVRYYANEMFRCVEAVHKHDIVHSDLKPANFLLVKGMLKIIDFGIANVVPDYTSNVHRDTQIGTPNYMAPEALLDASHVYANVGSSSIGSNRDEEVSTNPNYNYRNNRNSIQSIASINPTPHKPKTTKFKVGRPSDVWSCGCIIYQMIYGRPPYGAYQGTQRMLAIMNPKVPIAYPRQGLGQAKVPKEAIEAIKGCLDRDPTQRLTIGQVVDGAFLNPQAVDRRFIHDLLGHAVKYGADRGNSVTARELEMLTDNVWKKIQASNI